MISKLCQFLDIVESRLLADTGSLESCQDLHVPLVYTPSITAVSPQHHPGISQHVDIRNSL